MNNSITVRIRYVYGARKVYPVCRKAMALADIAGTKTLTDTALFEIQNNLGFAIKVEQEAL